MLPRRLMWKVNRRESVIETWDDVDVTRQGCRTLKLSRALLTHAHLAIALLLSPCSLPNILLVVSGRTWRDRSLQNMFLQFLPKPVEHWNVLAIGRCDFPGQHRRQAVETATTDALFLMEGRMIRECSMHLSRCDSQQTRLSLNQFRTSHNCTGRIGTGREPSTVLICMISFCQPTPHTWPTSPKHEAKKYTSAPPSISIILI